MDKPFISIAVILSVQFFSFCVGSPHGRPEEDFHVPYSNPFDNPDSPRAAHPPNPSPYYFHTTSSLQYPPPYPIPLIPSPYNFYSAYGNNPAGYLVHQGWPTVYQTHSGNPIYQGPSYYAQNPYQQTIYFPYSQPYPPTFIDTESKEISLLEPNAPGQQGPLATFLTKVTKETIKSGESKGTENKFPTPKTLTRRPTPPCSPAECTIAEILLHYTDPVSYCDKPEMSSYIYYGLQRGAATLEERAVIEELQHICEERHVDSYSGSARRTQVSPADLAEIWKAVEASKHPKETRCKPRIEIQELEVEPHMMYKPTCVAVKRCSGCCPDNKLKCLPTKTRKINQTVFMLKKKTVGARPGQDMEYVGNKTITIEHHMRCKVQCKVTKDSCSEYQFYDSQRCECRCKERRSCDAGKRWNERRCQCECSSKRPCSTGSAFSMDTCRCEKGGDSAR